jgi:hypothetical protein
MVAKRALCPPPDCDIYTTTSSTSGTKPPATSGTTLSATLGIRLRGKVVNDASLDNDVDGRWDNATDHFRDNAINNTWDDLADNTSLEHDINNCWDQTAHNFWNDTFRDAWNQTRSNVLNDTSLDDDSDRWDNTADRFRDYVANNTREDRTDCLVHYWKNIVNYSSSWENKQWSGGKIGSRGQETGNGELHRAERI